MSSRVFLTPYQAGKILDGVIPANQVVRPNWLQTWFPEKGMRYTETVNYDVEIARLHILAQNVLPTVDAPKVANRGYGHTELRFSYVKTGLASPDFEEINMRQMGEQFGQVDILANELKLVNLRLAEVAEQEENLIEYNAAQVIVYGKYEAVSERHPSVKYDFGRPIVTDPTEYAAGYVPSTDLTTLNFNGGVGKAAWDSTGGTKPPTPYEDLQVMCQTVLRRSNIEAVVMSNDAWKLLEADIKTNYRDAATLTLDVMQRVQLRALPVTEKYQNLNLRRSLPLGNGQYVDIYTYSAIYHDRNTGAINYYYPQNGYVSILPSKDCGLIYYGRILHPRAGYEPMRRYLNRWQDDKSGKVEWESEFNYLLAPCDPLSFVTWKVTSG